MTYSKLLSIILLIFSVFSISSQTVKIEKIGVDKGLSNNNIVSITQDRDDFIWVATKDGLNKFNSNTFKVFKTSESKVNSLCSNALNFVYADKFDDVVWVASEKKGVDAYNYKTHKFTHYENNNDKPKNSILSSNGVTYIDGDNKGNIWFATYNSGIDVLNKKTKQFTNYNTSNTPGLGSNYNWCVFYDSDEKIYIGHVNEGFSVLNIKTKTAVNYRHNPNDSSSLVNNTVTSILKDSYGRIWIGTRNGLSLFNPKSEKIINFKNDPKNPFSLSDNFIQQTHETKDHKLYIGTGEGGLNILDLNQLTFNGVISDIKFEHILASETSSGLSSLSVQAVIQDSFDNIWIGGLGGGLNFISNHSNGFNKIFHLPYVGNTNSLNAKSAHSLIVDTIDNVWVANDIGGIVAYNGGEKIKQINGFKNRVDSQIFVCINKSNTNNNIWAGTTKGEIYAFNSKLEKLAEIGCFKNKNIPIYYLFEDSKNNLWVATDMGLCRYNIISKQCILYTSKNSKLPDNIIRAIAEDASGNLWVGTLLGGLSVFDEDFNLVKNYGQTNDFYRVNHIYKDSKNRMWVCSQNDLFLMNNLFDSSIVPVGKNSGLIDSNTRAIIEGVSENDMWLSTTNGISKLDVNTMRVTNFGANDGIVFGDYLNGSVAKTSDGNIYFGSQNGISWFNQNMELFKRAAPKTTFTSFQTVNNKNYLNQFTDIPINDNIVLKHNENTFKINFNVLDYSLSNKVEFAYKMQGIDANWFLVDNENRLTFRNLKPGNYVFNLKERIQHNEWSNEVTSLFIKIAPPIWLTWWMKLFYIVLISAIFIYALRFYKNKLRIENDLLLEKKSRQQEQNLNNEKLKFFTNITHELRSPMTLILGPLEDLIAEGSLNPEQSRKLDMIQRISNRLLKMVNQLLEFRKSEDKSRKLNVTKENLAKYIYDIGLKYKDLNQNKLIDFQVYKPSQKIDVYFDPDVITIIIDNLLSNAFKYTQKGLINLELKNYKEGNIDYVEIVISDSGYGISEDNLHRIFERYYQAKNTSHPIQGTGIGLALVKNMVELHEAEIEVSSVLNKGTVFKVRFLTNNSYPDAIHYYPDDNQIEDENIEESSKNVILIVDDSPEILEYIKDSLGNSYTIISAENGKKGFQMACKEIPDIIISDVIMPIMDGVEMCKQVKQDIKTSHIPVLLLTAKGTLYDQKKGLDVGADGYLTKPFSSNLLKSRIKNILETRKQYALTKVSDFKQKQKALNESLGELDRTFLKNLTEVIEENLEDEKMNISYIAAQLSMSHSTLYRKIKGLTGLSATEFIGKVRVNYAEQLLMTGQYNVSEIMYQVGINSSSYFRQCFKEEFGVNPSEYLQKLKDS